MVASLILSKQASSRLCPRSLTYSMHLLMSPVAIPSSSSLAPGETYGAQRHVSDIPGFTSTVTVSQPTSSSPMCAWNTAAGGKRSWFQFSHPSTSCRVLSELKKGESCNALKVNDATPSRSASLQSLTVNSSMIENRVTMACL